MNKNIRRRLPCILVTGLLFLALAAFMVILISTKIVPSKFLLILGGAFVLLTLCVFLLTWDTRRIKSLVAGCVIMVLVLIILMVGAKYLMNTVDTLDNITAIDVEIAEVGIYVRQDDPAADIYDMKDYRFGIMQTLDRENTDKTVAEVEDKLGSALNITEYEGLAEIADALLVNNTADALIFNSAYLDILSEMEGYEDVADQLKEIHVQTVETTIESATEPQKDPLSFLKPFVSDTEEEKKNNTFTLYISGIDSRNGLIAKSRSDVNIIAVVNPDTRQIVLVSTPRDFFVPLPISNGVPDKLTHAGIYGVDVSIGTLEMLYGLDIDYYFRVNFSGFKNIIDALGGITVYSEIAFSSRGHSFRAGDNHLNGDAALVYARERYAFSSGDRQRGKNQMKVIKAVIEKAISPALLTNYSAIMESISGSFETSMPYDKIAELVRDQLDNGGSWNIVSISADGTGDSKRPYSMSSYAYVMIPDQSTVDAAKAKIQQVYDGEIIQ